MRPDVPRSDRGESRDGRARHAPGAEWLDDDALRKLVFGDAGNVHAFRELGTAGKLRKLGLIARNDGGSDELHGSRQTWTVSERVLAWLYGDESVDPLLAGVLTSPSCAGTDLSIRAETIAETVAAMQPRNAVVVVHGDRGLGRRSLIVHAADAARVDLFEVDVKRLSTQLARLTEQLHAISRECKLLGRAPLICNIDQLDAERIDLVGAELVGTLAANVFVTCGIQRPQLRWNRSVIAIEVKAPTSAQRAKLWRELVPQASATDAEHLSTQYPMAPALMSRAAQAVKARAVGRKITPGDITHGIRAVLDDRLGHFAKRIEVTQTWDDLVIDQDQAQAITELIARVRQRRTVYEQWGFAAKVGRGLGVAALFSGPPGTGKTMVAALIANELGLELYQVDMAKITSKFVGETEKQLGEMFDAAEAGHAILLFDEADSLFGKRTEVRSSNDRYANLETNYLLQRMESFKGICLLTSNHESNIDPAFQRRLSLHLRFQVPDADEREKLWRAMLPSQAPTDPRIDFDGLARRFEMSDGIELRGQLTADRLSLTSSTRTMYTGLLIDPGAAVKVTNLVVAGAAYQCVTLGNLTTGSISFATIADCGTMLSNVEGGPAAVKCGSSQVSLKSSIIWAPNPTYAPVDSCNFSQMIIGPTQVTGASFADPQSVDLAGHDLHLKPTSPAIDKIDSGPASDLAGTPRPQGAGFDLGAYEYKP